MRRRTFLRGAAGLGVAGLGGAVLGARAEEPSAKGPERVRVGYIGVGGRGTTHLRTMLELPGAEITAVCDIDPTALERAARLVGDARGKRPAAHEDYRRLLESKEVDAVLSALPCDLHARVYLDVIAAGKDLYAEKPMCITAAECDAVVKAAEASGLVVQVGFQRRYSRRMQEGIRRIHAGDIGELIEMRASFLASFGPLRGWFSRRARSGDWMVEQAVHVLDAMNWVFRTTPLRAYGCGRRDIFTKDEPDRDVTDYYSAIIEYPGGVIVNWLHSWICPGGPFSKHTCQVIGRKGAIDLYDGHIAYLDRERAAEMLPEEEANTTRIAQESFLDLVRKRLAGAPRADLEPRSGVRNGRDSVLAALLVRKAVDERRVVTWEEMLKAPGVDR
jgi:predicted dehydrogenase